MPAVPFPPQYLLSRRGSNHNPLCRRPKRVGLFKGRAPRPSRALQEAHGRTQAAPRSFHVATPPLPQAGQVRIDVRVEALRPRHQCPDARSHEPVPVRGARHLPADPHARGTRRPQEGHDRGRAQRAAGEPLPRRAGDGAGRDLRSDREGHSARGEVARRGDGPAVPADRVDLDGAAAVAGGRQGRQPDHRRRDAPRAAPSQAQGHPGVQGHQHAHQGARAGDGRRGLLQRQGARGHRAALLGHARAAGRLLGQARQGHGVVAAGRPHVLPADRPARAVAPAERVPLPREEGRGAVLRDRQGSPRARRRCCRRSRTTRTRRTTCGASPRATASRTSRSTCS